MAASGASSRQRARPRFEAPFLAGPHRVDRGFAERILAEALEGGGDFADLYFEYRRSASLSMEDGRIRVAGGGVDLGVGVRVVDGEAVGYAYAESLEEDELLEAARTAARIARGGGGTARIALRARRPANRYPVADPVVDAPGEDRVALLREADAAARRASARIVRVDASLVAVTKEILVASSVGAFVADRQPMVRIGVSAVARRGKRTEAGSSGGGGRRGLDYFDEVPASFHGEEAARVALVNLDARPAPAGEMPVVLAAGDAGILLHEAVGHGLEADFNRKRTSNYTDRIGEQVASPLVTVIDDPTIAGSRGSINVDDEGEVPGVHRLIVGGKLRSYMHDRISASFFGRKRAGSGRRESFRHPPMPRMTNTYMAAGQDDPEDIVRSVGRGIFAKRFSGGQVNISNGDFVFSLVEGYLIEDGRITAPLKGVNLIGNGPVAMEAVSMVGGDFRLSDGMWTCGKDGQSVPVGVGMPTVKVDALTVGGTEV